MPRQRSAIRNHIELAAYRCARVLARWLGARRLAAVGAFIGRFYLATGRRRRRIIDYNLALAFPEQSAPERRELARGVARHFGRVTLEVLRLATLTREQLLAEVSVEGVENLRAATAGGQGAFLLAAHMGCWEVAALIAGMHIPAGFAIINRPLDNPYLETELRSMRERFGNVVLGNRRVSAQIVKHLKRGGVVGILVDQRTIREDAIDVPFFGHPARTASGLARLVLAVGAPIVPIWSVWEGPGRIRVRFDPALSIADLPESERNELAVTSRLTALTEAEIRRHPEQWLWFHDRWREIRLGSAVAQPRPTDADAVADEQ
jgi:Kdo2-lipid IVA lauroyltransferase/acyltransferase